MRETVDTSKTKIIPEGEYIFTVDGVPEQIKLPKEKGGGSFRIWKLKYFNMNRGAEVIGSVIFFGNSEGYHDILKAMGGVEESPIKVTWEDEEVHGKKFSAKITHGIRKDGKPQEIFSDVKAVTTENWG